MSTITLTLTPTQSAALNQPAKLKTFAKAQVNFLPKLTFVEMSARSKRVNTQCVVFTLRMRINLSKTR